jgi:hypothetical protein
MNGFNLNATILNVLAPNSVLDMRGGTLSYVTVFYGRYCSFSGANNGRNFISGTVEYYGTTQTVKVVVIMIFSGASGIYTMASD